MTSEQPPFSAAAWPQGTCPKPWVALVAGNALFDGRGGLRRFSTEAAARKAAAAMAAEIAQRDIEYAAEAQVGAAQ